MGLRLNGMRVLVASVVIAALVFLAERLLEPGPGGSLLITMTMFLGLAEGAIVLMAGAELSDGHWHRPLLPRVAALYHVIPVIALLFIVNIPQLSIYPWIDQSGGWLNRNFFIGRHLFLLALAYFVARKFVAGAIQGTAKAPVWAVLIVLVFVAQLTMVGIEWFMSIEAPWFSTLFGAFFVVSAFLCGICTCALIIFGWRRHTDAPSKLVQKSIGGLIFGFATFWAYFYFSQLIVIWYGNIPEETDYLARRIGYHTPYWFVARLVFTMIWVIPFTVLLSRKNKTRPFVTCTLAVIAMSGVTLQYWLMLAPVVPVNIPLLLVEMALLTWLTAMVVRSYDTLLRVPAEVPDASRLAAETH
jgi:hypothetical protein